MHESGRDRSKHRERLSHSNVFKRNSYSRKYMAPEEEERLMILEAIFRAALETDDIETFDKKMKNTSNEEWMSIYKYAS